MTEVREEQSSPNGSGKKNWLDRISQALASEPRSRDQLVEVLREAQGREVINVDTLYMTEGVLAIPDMQVREVMIPRGQMAVIDLDDSLEKMLRTIVDSGHSRFPVINESRDEVEGILLAKDLLAYFAGGAQDEFDVTRHLRRVVYIPESKRLDVLLNEFRSNQYHMAIVVDEYGGVAGLVTIEDILEQIVGQIDDEYDEKQEANIYRHSATRHTVKALTPIDEFNDYFGADFGSEEFDTIGGLVMNAFGHLPKRGEFISIGRFQFKVLGADQRRIHLLKVTVLPPEMEEGEGVE